MFALFLHVCFDHGLFAAETIASATNAPSFVAVAQPSQDIPLSTWVGPGDAIRIKAYPDTASFISGTYTVFDSGCVVLPIVGVTQITKLSIGALTKQLTNTYAKYLAYPTMQIEPLIHLSMFGGFLRPGMYLVNPLYPFANALSASGGPVRDDGLKLLRWERHGKVLAQNLTQTFEDSKSLWALGFKSGDQVCVTMRAKDDMLSIVSFIISTVVASGTLYIAYETYTGGSIKK
jgi:protein involved in polysaccharide export with SLBB domain